MGQSVFFYRNPGQTLYDFVRHYYPEARAYLLKSWTALYLPGALLYEEDEDVIALFKFKAPLPPPEQIPQYITNTELDRLLDLATRAPLPDAGIDNIYYTYQASGLILLGDFMTYYFPHLKITPVFEKLWYTRPYTALDDGYQYNTYDGSPPFGYWAPQECQEVLPYLRAIVQQEHPDHLHYEAQIKNFLYKTYHSKSPRDPRAEISRRLKSSLSALRQSATILVKNLEALEPHEGLVGSYKY